MENVVPQRYVETRPLPKLAKAGLITMALSIPTVAFEGIYNLRRSPRHAYLEKSQAVTDYNQFREELLNVRSRLLDPSIEYQQIAPELAATHRRFREAAQKPEVIEYKELERKGMDWPGPISGVLVFFSGVAMLAAAAFKDRDKVPKETDALQTSD